MLFRFALPVMLCACATAGGVQSPGGAPVPVDVAYPDQGHDHIPHPAFPHAPYASNPPTSGPHTPYTAPWGVHRKPVPNEVLLHNLEHGGIVIGHRCADCPDLVNELAELAADYPRVIVAPNPDLPTPIALSAWGHALAIEALDEPARQAIAAFLERHHGVDHHPRGPHGHAPPPAPAAP